MSVLASDIPPGFRWWREIRYGRAREPVTWTAKDRDGTERDIRKGLPGLAPADPGGEDRVRWQKWPS